MTMEETITKVAIFVSGLAIGSLTTWKFVKDKYEKIANEDIEAVRSYYYGKIKKTDESEVEDEVDSETDEQDMDEYTETIANEGYINYSNICAAKKENKKEDDEDMSDKPYVISPDEFGENDDYDTVSLTYYDDGILADDQNQIIDDVEDVVGDAIEHIGDYEDDTVHVRNDKLKTDFEILRDLDRFCDIAQEAKC